MNNLYFKIINFIVYGLRKSSHLLPEHSVYRLAKLIHIFRRTIRRSILNLVFIIIGVFSAAFGLKGFLLPNSFIDGGITGVSLLLTHITHIPIYILIIFVNIPFIIISIKQINLNFAFKTTFAIIGLAIVLAFVKFPVITSDKLLVAVFGGFFLGAGIGMTVRGGAVLDGTEILAIFICRKISLTIGDVILVINIIIFSFAAWLLTVETALYSILIYLAASKTVDFIIEGIEEYIGITIISAKSEEIRKMIIETMGRGVTIYKGKRGFGKRGDSNMDLDIVFTVITRLEISKIDAETEKIDPNAFIIAQSVKDTKGGMIKKRPLRKL